MGRKLDEFIQKYLDADNKVPAEYKESVAEGLKNELKKEFFNDYKAELLAVKQDVNQQKANEIALRRFSEKIKALKRTVLNAIAISFLMGMLVNQTTDLITYFKIFDETSRLFWTFMFILLFLILAMGAVYFMYNNSLEELTQTVFKEKGEKHE